MRKLIFVLMPICIIIGLIAYTFNTSPSFYNFISGLSDLEFVQLEFTDLDSDFDTLFDKLEGYWTTEYLGSLSQVWGDIDGLSDFFVALGNTFVYIWNCITAIYFSITKLFEILWYFLIYCGDFFKFLGKNLIVVIQFTFNLLFVS